LIQKFKQTLTVDKNIVPLLSKSTYLNSFAHAIREMVSNAYDADALKVDIKIDTKNLNKITIIDDGNGMSKDDFEHFCRIAGQKRQISKSTKFKRNKIGLFGIGFLSVFPFCEVLEVTTTIENSTQILNAKIPTKNYFEINIDEDVQEIEFDCTISEDISQRQKHYTEISLHKSTHFLRKYFKKPNINKRGTILIWEPLERFLWELRDDLPLQFPPKSKFSDILKYKEPIGIEVYVNNKPIYRNEPSKNILDINHIVVDEIEYKYLISTDFKSIWPQEARGLKIRLNNVGVGNRTDFDLSKERGFSRLHWLNGEIHISEIAKEFLSINRDSFISDPNFENLLISIKEILKKQAYLVDEISIAEKEIYESIEKNRAISRVIPKSEIIEKNIDILKSKGFKIKNIPSDVKHKLKDIDFVSPIVINKEDKTITILKDEKLKVEKEKVLGKNFRIRYNKWNYENTEYPSCKFIDDNTIEINRDYPLFKSKQYGNLFKKIHLMFLVAFINSKDKNEVFSKIMNEFSNEFKEF
jgi:hypothetical protein